MNAIELYNRKAEEVVTLAKMIQDYAKMRAALAGLVGAESKADLDAMEAVIRAADEPSLDEKMKMVTAIQLLRETADMTVVA